LRVLGGSRSEVSRMDSRKCQTSRVPRQSRGVSCFWLTVMRSATRFLQMHLPAFACRVLTALVLAAALPAWAANPAVEMSTSLGTIRIELYRDKAPKTVANFLQYVEDRFYDGTIFHRVIPGFMVQGGGFDVEMAQKKTREPIGNEAQ